MCGPSTGVWLWLPSGQEEPGGGYPLLGSDTPMAQTCPLAEPQQHRHRFHRVQREISPQRGDEPALAWQSVDEVSESSKSSQGRHVASGKPPKGAPPHHKMRRNFFSPSPAIASSLPGREPRHLRADFCFQILLILSAHAANPPAEPRCGEFNPEQPFFAATLPHHPRPWMQHTAGVQSHVGEQSGEEAPPWGTGPLPRLMLMSSISLRS